MGPQGDLFNHAAALWTVPWLPGSVDSRFHPGPRSRVDGRFASAHRLTTAPWTTLWVALSLLDGPFGPDHTVHSDDDDEQPDRR